MGRIGSRGGGGHRACVPHHAIGKRGWWRPVSPACAGTPSVERGAAGVARDAGSYHCRAGACLPARPAATRREHSCPPPQLGRALPPLPATEWGTPAGPDPTQGSTLCWKFQRCRPSSRHLRRAPISAASLPTVGNGYRWGCFGGGLAAFASGADGWLPPGRWLVPLGCPRTRLLIKGAWALDGCPRAFWFKRCPDRTRRRGGPSDRLVS